MKRHPLARAVRLDKASIAGLAATLRLYIDGVAEQRVPVWRMIALPAAVIAGRAAAIAAAVGAEASVIEGRSMVGGGSLPEESLQTTLVALASPKISATKLAARLREHNIIARVEERHVLLDPRTIAAHEDTMVVAACASALAER